MLRVGSCRDSFHSNGEMATSARRTLEAILCGSPLLFTKTSGSQLFGRRQTPLALKMGKARSLMLSRAKPMHPATAAATCGLKELNILAKSILRLQILERPTCAHSVVQAILEHARTTPPDRACCAGC